MCDNRLRNAWRVVVAGVAVLSLGAISFLFFGEGLTLEKLGTVGIVYGVVLLNIGIAVMVSKSPNR